MNKIKLIFSLLSILFIIACEKVTPSYKYTMELVYMHGDTIIKELIFPENSNFYIGSSKGSYDLYYTIPCKPLYNFFEFEYTHSTNIKAVISYKIIKKEKL